MHDDRTAWIRRTALALALLTGCGGGDAGDGETAAAEPAEAATTEGGETAAVTGPPKPWHEMTHEEQGEYMNDVVLPEMASLFQAFDAEEFADFDCSTCHGDDARAVGFHMPNGLHPLDPADIPTILESDDPMAVFMSETVYPRMTELLGMEHYDPETGTGFSCLDCHENAASGG